MTTWKWITCPHCRKEGEYGLNFMGRHKHELEVKCKHCEKYFFIVVENEEVIGVYSHSRLS